MCLKKDSPKTKDEPPSGVSSSTIQSDDKTEDQKQREYQKIKNEYFELKKRYDNIIKLLAFSRDEYTSYKIKASVICFVSYIIIALLISNDYPEFFNGWFILYFLLCIIIYAFVIWVGGSDYRNNSKSKEELELQLPKVEKKYNEIKHLIIEPQPKQELHKTTPQKKELPKQYVSTYHPPKSILSPQPVTQAKSAPPAPQPSESEQTMKSQLDKKAQDELKKYIIQIAIVGSVLLLILAFIPLLLLFLL